MSPWPGRSEQGSAVSVSNRPWVHKAQKHGPYTEEGRKRPVWTQEGVLSKSRKKEENQKGERQRVMRVSKAGTQEALNSELCKPRLAAQRGPRAPQQ